MRILTSILATVLASPTLAKSFDRPIPQSQSATAEFWFALSSVALIAALVLVQRLVARK
ncbi:protein NnrT [Sinisalibacter lacisalsi]|uniref:Protein NnrT n=1 Tax=Sinisalibacter lacisalsi TaxID=1526570 RepID=A0ABQ1QJC6_9RHOB|nr:protein NnrT [Sinisalibacter lacisalsi]GGD29808.1 hypothetical protein GCM10011358_12270 [Sinisalibacter lacisalsi]